MQQSPLQFIPFTPIIDIGFWTTLAKKKIEEYRLDDAPKDIVTKYKINNYKEKYSHLAFDIYSFQSNDFNKSGPLEQLVETVLINYNTVEDYKSQDAAEFLKTKTAELLENLKNKDDSILKAYILMFADLKKYVFSYKVMVPQLQVENFSIENSKGLKEILKEQEQLQLISSIKSFINERDYKTSLSRPYYFIEIDSYRHIDITEAKLSDKTILVYFDAFNQTQLNATFMNLMTKLMLEGFKKLQVYVIKDFVTYGNQKVEFKNSVSFLLDISQANIILKNEAPVPFDLQHYQVQKDIDLKGFMDERYLARDAVDLNIKLMKWRMIPHVDLELIKSTKCLLFGAGTLGCQLARNLIGWGVRTINFVDYGKISYSNPVRQSLFDFEDSCNGGKPKAEVAAEKLKKIFPDIESQGYQVEIPMPGHYVGEHQVDKTVETINFLDQLVEQHDAIFLLTDSREARWFPTLLSNKHKKICFAVALGFDSFLVIRHGISTLVYDSEIHGERLSCYYCNDISAPQDSMRDRTLDQQCTVTRPGLSFLAAAYASELLISLIQHPLRDGAPASDDTSQLESTDLGILPHFLRGQLSDFNVSIFYGKAFTNCVACSQYILDEYVKEKEQFILRVLNDPDYLQEVSKINEQFKNCQISDDITEIVDDFALIQ